MLWNFPSFSFLKEEYYSFWNYWKVQSILFGLDASKYYWLRIHLKFSSFKLDSTQAGWCSFSLKCVGRGLWYEFEFSVSLTAPNLISWVYVHGLYKNALKPMFNWLMYDVNSATQKIGSELLHIPNIQHVIYFVLNIRMKTKNIVWKSLIDPRHTCVQRYTHMRIVAPILKNKTKLKKVYFFLDFFPLFWTFWIPFKVTKVTTKRYQG